MQDHKASLSQRETHYPPNAHAASGERPKFRKWHADMPTGERSAQSVMENRLHYAHSLTGLAGAVVHGFAKKEDVARSLHVSVQEVRAAVAGYQRERDEEDERARLAKEAADAESTEKELPQ